MHRAGIGFRSAVVVCRRDQSRTGLSPRSMKRYTVKRPDGKQVREFAAGVPSSTVQIDQVGFLTGIQGSFADPPGRHGHQSARQTAQVTSWMRTWLPA